VPAPSGAMRRPSGRTLPTNSAPSISFGNSSRKCMSDPQTVAIDVLTIISPGPGSGVGMSTISTLPLAGLTQARMGNLPVPYQGAIGPLYEHSIKDAVKGP